MGTLTAAACSPGGTPLDTGSTGNPEVAPAGLPTATPSEVGLSAEALKRIRPAMQAYVDDGRKS